VYSRRHTCQGGTDLRFERAKVAGVHNIRFEFTQGAPESRVHSWVETPLAFFERHQRHSRPGNLPAQFREAREAYDGMAVSRGGHMVDQIDEPVLETAQGEAVNQMCDQGRSGQCACQDLSPSAGDVLQL
jgi:hypothetical protein